MLIFFFLIFFGCFSTFGMKHQNSNNNDSETEMKTYISSNTTMQNQKLDNNKKTLTQFDTSQNSSTFGMKYQKSDNDDTGTEMKIYNSSNTNNKALSNTSPAAVDSNNNNEIVEINTINFATAHKNHNLCLTARNLCLLDAELTNAIIPYFEDPLHTNQMPILKCILTKLQIKFNKNFKEEEIIIGPFFPKHINSNPDNFVGCASILINEYHLEKYNINLNKENINKYIMIFEEKITECDYEWIENNSHALLAFFNSLDLYNENPELGKKLLALIIHCFELYFKDNKCCSIFSCCSYNSNYLTENLQVYIASIINNNREITSSNKNKTDTKNCSTLLQELLEAKIGKAIVNGKNIEYNPSNKEENKENFQKKFESAICITFHDLKKTKSKNKAILHKTFETCYEMFKMIDQYENNHKSFIKRLYEGFTTTNEKIFLFFANLSVVQWIITLTISITALIFHFHLPASAT